jgi:pentatricopeptide repeat protein
MIIALAHAGFPDAAHVHRMRILDQGLTPSADAYGVLIQHVKDTTDDTSGAMALFGEASERFVKMNLYLYNNIISKLSKARKADYALELFQQMKASHVVPSSITYGAVIGACARVGDVKSAELLFQEMVHSRNFKPRVPPYNTMMQLHTTTKPNRTSALHYYNEMKQAGVKPSSHTYKVRL